MTPTVLWALLAVAAVVGIVAIARSIMTSKTRAKAGLAREAPPIDQKCAAGGHTYGIYGTGWRCAECGNHIPRREGELYGPAEDGREDRRRQPR